MAATFKTALRHKLLTSTKVLARAVGVEVKRRRNELDEENVLRQLFDDTAIDFVVDVGANKGQYAAGLRAYGYAGPIVSFEALPQVHAALIANSAGDAGWIVAPQLAVGESAGSVSIHVAANSASSSLLPMLGSHIEAAPESGYIGSIDVPMQRLDAVLPGLLAGQHSGLLKVDTQGYEDRVLRGAAGVMQRFAAVQLEISMAPLYEGQAKSADLVRQLDEFGFRLGYIIEGFRHPSSGRLLQFDGVFVRA